MTSINGVHQLHSLMTALMVSINGIHLWMPLMAFIINDSYKIVSRRISNVGISFTQTDRHTHRHTNTQTIYFISSLMYDSYNIHIHIFYEFNGLNIWIHTNMNFFKIWNHRFFVVQNKWIHLIVINEFI